MLDRHARQRLLQPHGARRTEQEADPQWPMNDGLTRDNRLGNASEVGDPLIDKMAGKRSCIDLIISAAINRLFRG